MYEQQRKVDREPQDDYPMSSYAPSRTPPVTMPSMSAGPPSNYGDDALRYPSTSHASGSMGGPSYHAPNGQDYPQRSPALGYVPMAANGSESRSMDAHGRMARYDAYASYSIDTTPRDSGWVPHPGTSVSDGSMDSSSAAHSPTFVESPTLTASELQYSSRYGVVEDQKVPLTPLATSQYMFAPSRSLSPAASTPSSTSSTSLAPASYAFTFPEGTNIADRPEFYRRTTNPPELTLHGGTADVTTILRMSGRANPSAAPGTSSTNGGGGGGDRIPGGVQAPSPYARGDNGSHERESDGESSAYTYGSRPRTRTGTALTATCADTASTVNLACGTEFVAAQACKVDTGSPQRRGGRRWRCGRCSVVWWMPRTSTVATACITLPEYIYISALPRI